MKITIESTTKMVELNGVPARLWEGYTESGIKVHCFITRIACELGADQTQFKEELEAQRAPSKEFEVYSLRMIL